jgi:DNA-binding response OmpR family regulator
MAVPHILFADDDPDTREMIEMFLQLAGFRVSIVESGADFLDRIATREHVDAYVLDNWMPDITGVEICQQIRSVDQDTPIFFCSGAVALRIFTLQKKQARKPTSLNLSTQTI